MRGNNFNRGDVHNVIVLDIATAITMMTICSVVSILLPKGVQYVSQAILYSTVTTGSQFSHKPRAAMWQHNAHEEGKGKCWSQQWDKLQLSLCAEKTVPRTPTVSQSSPLLAFHKSVPASCMPSKLIIGQSRTDIYSCVILLHRLEEVPWPSKTSNLSPKPSPSAPLS